MQKMLNWLLPWRRQFTALKREYRGLKEENLRLAWQFRQAQEEAAHSESAHAGGRRGDRDGNVRELVGTASSLGAEYPGSSALRLVHAAARGRPPEKYPG